MCIVAKDDRRALELSEALDVDLTRRVHENVRDVRISHQRLDGTEPVDLVYDLVGELRAIALAQRDGLLVDQLSDRRSQLRIPAGEIETGETRDVDTLEQQPVQA